MDYIPRNIPTRPPCGTCGGRQPKINSADLPPQVGDNISPNTSFITKGKNGMIIYLYQVMYEVKGEKRQGMIVAPANAKLAYEAAERAWPDATIVSTIIGRNVDAISTAIDLAKVEVGPPVPLSGPSTQSPLPNPNQPFPSPTIR
jgi:hypothetical protein